MWRASLLHILLALAVVTKGHVPFSVTDCMSNEQLAPLSFSDVRVAPYPIPIPNIKVNATMIVREVIDGRLHLLLNVQMRYGLWMTIPGLGSRDFDDVCGRLSSISPVNCPPQLIKDNFPCTCPFTPGTYVIRNAIFHIPHSGGFWSWMKKGDYRLTARLTTSKGRELACQRVEMTIAGWL